MPLDQRATSYADKLLLRSRREIDAKLKTAIEEVVNSSHRPGSILPGVLLKGLVDVYVTRIRELGIARMDALLTAYADAGIPLDETVVGEIKADVLALCHSEQHNAIGAANKMAQIAFGGVAATNADKVTVNGIVQGVDQIMADLALELDIRSEKHVLNEVSRKRIYGSATGKRWDVFISHASEDKDDFVRPLAEALTRSGLEVWFDETALKVGDRLRESIDHGLSKSRYGVVVLSKHFFQKHWTKEELEGLSSREVGGIKVILPVWHNVTQGEVAEHSPTLAGRLAAQSQHGMDKVVRQLREAMVL
jgi:hypothetical protein